MIELNVYFTGINLSHKFIVREGFVLHEVMVLLPLAVVIYVYRDPVSGLTLNVKLDNLLREKTLAYNF
ncbi:MAG: hypothetical protein BWX96_02772 [Bacteroidetes bacterium ADurb.Bin145]|nr:MAG: hypothetical protein BWX96_02772 [Bacteroidetes bacterium ADurb.Bin145]